MNKEEIIAELNRIAEDLAGLEHDNGAGAALQRLIAVLEIEASPPPASVSWVESPSELTL